MVCGLRVAYCIHIRRSELSFRMEKKKSVYSEMSVHINRGTFGCLIAKLFLSQRIGGRDSAASRQVENRSSAIYRDRQRAFEQFFVPSASDSFYWIFEKIPESRAPHVRSVAR